MAMNKILVSIFVLVKVIVIIKSAKILAVFPIPSISHQSVFQKLTHELVKRGHQVTVITPDPVYSKNKSLNNLTEIDVREVTYGMKKQILQNINHKDLLKLSKEKQYVELLSNIFETQFSVPEVQDIYLKKKNEKFDLILLEGCIRTELILSYIYKAPVIMISSLAATIDVYEAIGAPTHPILYPTVFYERLYNLTLYEKIGILWRSLEKRYEDIVLEKKDNLIIQKYFGPDVPSLKELYSNIDMVFVNIHPIWADNQPVPPGVVYMGGIHQTETKQLPKGLKNYLDSSQNGVVYLSFGSNLKASILPAEKIEIIARVLSELPYDILWKWDEDELPIKSNNIKLSKWLPQADLLNHPKIKLFITQAGLQSTDESITAGVPLVAIPIFGDQFYNAEKYVRHGIGKMLLMENINTDEFKAAVTTVINDRSYRNNVIRLRNLMLDQPHKPLDRSIWWIEYILRHGGGKHLRAPAANIEWIEYFQIDVVLTLLVVLLLYCIVVVKICNCVVKLLFTNKINIKNKIHY